MRLSKQHLSLIERMEGKGYVWLSHLTTRAQMRFRDRTRRGYSNFIKKNGLTFLTKEVAEFLESTSRERGQPRVKVTEKLQLAEDKLYQLSAENEALRTILLNFLGSVSKEGSVQTEELPDGRILCHCVTEFFLTGKDMKVFNALTRPD